MTPHFCFKGIAKQKGSNLFKLVNAYINFIFKRALNIATSSLRLKTHFDNSIHFFSSTNIISLNLKLR